MRHSVRSVALPILFYTHLTWELYCLIIDNYFLSAFVGKISLILAALPDNFLM